MAWTATRTQALINGQWVQGRREPIEVVNPATEHVLCAVANVDVQQGLDALAAAADAQFAWARTPARQRAEVLRKAFELVVSRTDDLASVMTAEMGKPLAEARGEVAYGGEFLRWFSEEAPRVGGHFRASPEGTARHLVTRRPVGPCLFITPWNFPFAMATRKVAPALAAGCTVVLRPASLTPLTALLFGEILVEAGVPDGVVNVVVSADHDVTDAIIDDSRLRKLSFTGSTGVGRTLLRQAAKNVLRVSMELGGNAPLIVFEDADLDVAVPQAQAAKLRNIGEACTSANRFIVHRSIAGEFASRLASDFSGLTVGDGARPGVDVGPLITAEARQGVHRLVRSAIEAGARLLTGGEPVDGPGYGYRPTVLTDVPRDCEIARTEIFGPVVAITTFDTEDEAVAVANDTELGLAGYVFTRDMGRVLRMAEVLETGMIGVNTGVVSNAAAPFGGVKQSGIGREGSHEGIEEFLEPIYICFPDPFANAG